jgi:hypothetical protein
LNALKLGQFRRGFSLSGIFSGILRCQLRPGTPWSPAPLT